MFDRINVLGLHVRANICSFGVNDARHLDHVFSSGEYHYDKKIKPLFNDYTLPVMSKDLESFIGTTNYHEKSALYATVRLEA